MRKSNLGVLVVKKGLVYLGLFVLAVVLGTIVSFVLAIPVYFLWNWIMPKLFGLPEVNYLQSWGICLLSGLLFGIRTNSKSKD
jgi:hypothetical protein